MRTQVTDAVDAARRRARSVVDGLEDRRSAHPALDVAWRVLELDRDVNGSILAAAIALRLFVFVVPLGLVLVTGIGLLADASQQSPTELARQAGITGLIASAVGSAGDLTILNRVVLLVGGLYASVRAAGSLRQAMVVAHAVVWGERPGTRTAGLRPPIALLGVATIAAGLLLVLGRVRTAHAGIGAALMLVVVIVPFIGWMDISIRLPHGDAERRDLVPGALLLAAGVQVVHLATVYVLARRVTGRSETYGALAVAMAILVWATFLGRLVVAAAELDVATWQRRREAPPGPPRGRGPARPGDGGDPRPARRRAMSTLTIWKFARPDGADRAEQTLQGLARQRLITIDDAATVSWPADKARPRTRQMHSVVGGGAADGAFWGLLFGVIFFVPLLGAAMGAATGALAGSLTDVGIDDDVIRSVRSEIVPGTSALFLMSHGAVVDRVHEAFQGAEAQLVSTNLSPEQEEALRGIFAS